MLRAASAVSCLTCRSADLSIEQVAALASQNSLPEPSLDLGSLAASPSTFSPGLAAGNLPRSPAPQYSSDDPWNTAFRNTPGFANGANAGAPSTVSGGGMPREWWKRQESVSVDIVGHQGFLLSRHMVYSITTAVRLVCLCYETKADEMFSAGSQCKGDILNSCSCGIAWSGGTLSAFYLRSLPNASAVCFLSPFLLGSDSKPS